MKKSLQVGITGGIGSGKSLICKIFGCLGIPVYDADSRAKFLMHADPVLVEQIQQAFGSEAYESSGNLNRVYLAKEVFSHPVKLTQLNQLVHPRVAADYQDWYIKQEDGIPYVLKEAALLIEADSYKMLDKLIVVTSPLALRLKRLTARDRHRTPQQLQEIIERQLSDEEKIRYADYVIRNDESDLLIPQVIALHQEFRALVH